MEPILGRGYSINEESDLINQYSPLSSTADDDIEQDDDLFYPDGENGSNTVREGTEDETSSTLPNSVSVNRSSSSIDEITGMGSFGKMILF